jgi:acyl-[acyl-carrier-protein]-phospholipid O-acyltransferase / long-chain-fatty-acid--[acyl-carrier-protein] ligase
MTRALLAERRFAPLFWCQFFSAFNDNFLKNALVFLIVWGIGGAGAGALVALAGAVFIAPFFLLSGLGGELADRFDKARLAERLKFAEIAAGGLAAAGFLLASVPVLFAALAAFGVISALFGPVKYAILPDHLPKERLNAANALVEFATFLAILAGTISGGLAAAGGGHKPLFAALVMLFALLSWGAARLIPPTGQAAPDLRLNANVLASALALIGGLRADRRVWRASLMTAWFWLVGSIALALLPPLVRGVLGGDEAAAAAALCAFSIGIGLGSAVAARLTGGRIILLPSVIGALLMGFILIELWRTTHGMAVPPVAGLGVFLARPRVPRVLLDLTFLAAAGGLLVVPAFTAVQAWAGPDRRARSIAGVNVLSAGAMVGGALVLALAQRLGAGPPALFGLFGLSGAAVAVLMLATLPTNPARDLLWMLFRVAYRVTVEGAENFAAAGPRAVIALNHVSWLDAALAVALLDQEPVFAINVAIARRWWVRPWLRFVRALAMDPQKPFATRLLIDAVRAGDPLVIFPEGRLTVTGSLMKVYDGAALIADKADAAIVPVRLEGLEATPFSRLQRSQVRRRWFPRVRVSVLEPTRIALDRGLVGRRRREAGSAALYDIMSDLIRRTTPTDRTVFEAVAEAARVHGRSRVAVEDPITGRLSYRRLLASAAVLGRALARATADGEAVGVMLPNSNAVAATVLGLMSAGRVPAMLNFSAGAANLLAACRAAEAGTVVTSRAFLEKARLVGLAEALAQHVRLVYLEDVRAGVGRIDRLGALLRGGRPRARRQPDDPAVVLFTSGSEGAPKGVVLSHRNMLANAAQAAARIDFGRQDRLFNVLPVFHSFGLTAGLVLPLVSGVPVFLYPSPLHYRVVPELVYGSNATILFGTDTFLAGYARTSHPYDFRSLRYVLAGAEPVKPATRNVYLEKFGLRVLEGYGVTEASPVLALNTPMANRFGTVGRLLPGIEARLEPVPGIEGAGRLYVRGPNVMLGYLRTDRPGVIEPPPEGWHDTGDIVAIDAQGFLTIRGRAKHFAKIGGEMVSLAAVEALAAELWPGAISAVVAVPDPRKGERLLLLTERADATRVALVAHARARGASEMMIPAEVRVVPALPLLGTGKVDLVAAQRMADAAIPIGRAA